MNGVSTRTMLTVGLFLLIWFLSAFWAHAAQPIRHGSGSNGGLRTHSNATGGYGDPRSGYN